jgi:hypothetical protein
MISIDLHLVDSILLSSPGANRNVDSFSTPLVSCYHYNPQIDHWATNGLSESAEARDLDGVYSRLRIGQLRRQHATYTMPSFDFQCLFETPLEV